MEKVFCKKLWKDILIMIILLSMTFIRYVAFKEIPEIKYTIYTLTTIAASYAFFYTLFNCKSNKERLFLFGIYSLSFLFMYWKDSLDVFIYLLLASIFLENRDKFLQVYFVTAIAIICLSIACYYFKLIPNNDVYRNEELRYSLGFSHPNTIFRYFFGSLIALYMMDKKKTVFNVYAIGIVIPLYLLTDSRTGLISVMLFVILANLSIIFEKIIKMISLKYAFLFLTVFVFAFVFEAHANTELNDLLSSRPSLLYDLVVNAKWHLLYGNMDYLYCDDRIIYLLIRNGITALVLVNIFYYLVFRKESNVELKVVFIMSMIYGLTENFRSLGQTIVPLLCMWSLYDHYVKNKIGFEMGENIQKLTNNDNN